MAAPNLNFKTLDSLYFHLAGAGNTAYATVVTSTRIYVMTLTAAATNTIQFLGSGRIQRIYIVSKCAAAGTIEVSRVSTSQIATATPDVSVLARADIEPVTTSGLPLVELVFDYS
jgi:hypothetical protein